MPQTQIQTWNCPATSKSLALPTTVGGTMLNSPMPSSSQICIGDLITMTSDGHIEKYEISQSVPMGVVVGVDANVEWVIVSTNQDEVSLHMKDFGLVIDFVRIALGLCGVVKVGSDSHGCYRTEFSFYKMKWFLFWNPEEPELIVLKEWASIDSETFNIANPDCATEMREELRKYGIKGAYDAK